MNGVLWAVVGTAAYVVAVAWAAPRLGRRMASMSAPCPDFVPVQRSGGRTDTIAGLSTRQPTERVLSPVPSSAATVICRCGHSAGFHTHYRRGSDCAACGPHLCFVFDPTRNP